MGKPKQDAQDGIKQLVSGFKLLCDAGVGFCQDWWNTNVKGKSASQTEDYNNDETEQETALGEDIAFSTAIKILEGVGDNGVDILKEALSSGTDEAESAADTILEPYLAGFTRKQQEEIIASLAEILLEVLKSAPKLEEDLPMEKKPMIPPPFDAAYVDLEVPSMDELNTAIGGFTEDDDFDLPPESPVIKDTFLGDVSPVSVSEPEEVNDYDNAARGAVDLAPTIAGISSSAVLKNLDVQAPLSPVLERIRKRRNGGV